MDNLGVASAFGFGSFLFVGVLVIVDEAVAAFSAFFAFEDVAFEVLLHANEPFGFVAAAEDFLGAGGEGADEVVGEDGFGVGDGPIEEAVAEEFLGVGEGAFGGAVFEDAEEGGDIGLGKGEGFWEVTEPFLHEAVGFELADDGTDGGVRAETLEDIEDFLCVGVGDSPVGDAGAEEVADAAFGVFVAGFGVGLFFFGGLTEALLGLGLELFFAFGVDGGGEGGGGTGGEFALEAGVAFAAVFLLEAGLVGGGEALDEIEDLGSLFFGDGVEPAFVGELEDALVALGLGDIFVSRQKFAGKLFEVGGC